MNRRSFIKRLSLLIAGWQMSGVLKNAWALEEIPTPLPYPEFIAKYMQAGLNLCLNPYGIYIHRVETSINLHNFAHLVRGLATKHRKGCTITETGHLVDPDGFVVITDHRVKTKYFSFLATDEALDNYKVRQVLLKDSAINILKAYGGTGL